MVVENESKNISANVLRQLIFHSIARLEVYEMLDLCKLDTESFISFCDKVIKPHTTSDHDTLVKLYYHLFVNDDSQRLKSSQEAIATFDKYLENTPTMKFKVYIDFLTQRNEYVAALLSEYCIRTSCDIINYLIQKTKNMYVEDSHYSKVRFCKTCNDYPPGYTYFDCCPWCGSDTISAVSKTYWLYQNKWLIFKKELFKYIRQKNQTGIYSVVKYQ